MEAKKAFQELRIVFMGTPEFAVASLNALLKAGCNICAVITAPDKPGGRGMEIQQSAVKKFSEEKQLKILQPIKLKDPIFLDNLKELRADLQIVVAFRMLPEIVWNMPPLGTVNLHGSLLPQYRGAAPINWAVINGENYTGVTTFKLVHEIDKGNILKQKVLPISESDTAGTVHDKMKEIGAVLLVETVKELADNKLVPIPQEQFVELAESELKHAPKLFTENCIINFNQPLEKVYNLVRGLSPYPTAYTLLNGKKFKIFYAEKVAQETGLAPAKQFETDNKSYLRFYCNDGLIDVKEVQLEGKKKMMIGEFLRGYHF